MLYFLYSQTCRKIQAMLKKNKAALLLPYLSGRGNWTEFEPIFRWFTWNTKVCRYE